MRSRYLSLLAVLGCFACGQEGATLSSGSIAAVTSGDTVTMSAEPGVVIARDSLTAFDQNVLPCCSTDSAGVHIQVTGGTLTFYAAASYGAMMNTPAGSKPLACVQGVPNGAIVERNSLLMLVNGESYLLMPCTAGYYSAILTEQLSYTDGSSATRQVTLSSGRYGWQRDLLSLTEQGTVGGATASMSGATIAVIVPGHRYAFLALPR